MEEQMYVYASVDEADIGLIREAQQRGEPVHFTVDAYPEELFEGKVDQIRMNPTTEQNVVTYPVVITCANPELKLMPGMTATISFQVEKRDDAIRVPNAALRFYPPRPELVREADRPILEGSDKKKKNADEAVSQRSASERAEASKKRNRRHVWILEGEKLAAVEITTGLIDNKFTELVEGDLAKGQKLVTGLENR